MSSATVRVVCHKCGSKLDIRAELAGSTRRCPKCKTEFVVPAPEDEDDGVSLVEDDASDVVAEIKLKTPPPKSRGDAPVAEAAKPSTSTLPVGGDDDDDDDYMPSFVTASAKDDRKTPLPPVPTKPADDDEGPVLSIPKIPPPTKPKFKSFDPAEFEDEEDEPPRRSPSKSTPIPASREKAGRGNLLSDEFDLDQPSPPPKSRGPNRSASLSDSSIPTPSPTRDRAAAARELRQALKDSSLREPQEQETRGGFSFDFSGLWSEIGIKGVAIILGVVLIWPALYYASTSMMGGGLKLPPLGYVTGTVTYNGQPTANALVYFKPVPDPNAPSDVNANPDEPRNYNKIRTSFGTTNEKGEYKLMYMEGVQGAAIGQCRVWLQLEPPLVAPGEFSPASITLREVKSGSQKHDFALTGNPPKQ